MSPMISLDSEKNEISKNYKTLRDEKNKLLKIRKYVEKNFEYVGKDFSKRVKKFITIKKIIKLFMALRRERKKRSHRRRY